MAFLFRLGLWLGQWLNPGVAWRLSGWIGALLDLLHTDAARVTRINLGLCFPELSEPERRKLCRASLRHMALLFFEFAQLAHWPRTRLLEQISEIQGKALLDQVYAEGDGALLLVPHFGNWEILCAYLGEHYGFAALYNPPKVAALEPVILQVRERFQGALFAIDTGGMRKLLKVLKQGKMVVILPDQVPERSHGLYAPFFDHPALTMTLAHRLVERGGRKVLVCSIQRVADERGYHYRLAIEPLLEDPRAQDKQGFVENMNRSIEQVVRRSPAQYQWEYKRFKRPPEQNTPNVYRRQ